MRFKCPRCPAVVLAAALLVALSTRAGADGGCWPQYRGPDARGVDDSQALPTKWDLATGENIRWQTPLPGLAHASPIVWGDRVYVATAVQAAKAELKVGLYGDITPVEEKEPHQWRLLALDAKSGAVVWNVVGCEAVPKIKRHPKSSHCNSTPATDGRRIAAIFGSQGLFCFDLEGKLLWQKDLGPMDSGYYLQTPIVVGDRLFACGDAGNATCLDARTGAVKDTSRLSTTFQGFTSSPVSDGRHLYWTSELGVVFVVPVAEKLSVVATNDLHETCMSTPAIGGGALFFRTRDKLIAVGAKQ